MDYIHRNDLISSAQLARLRERSGWRAGTHLIGHALLIALTGTALHFAWGSLWCVPFYRLPELDSYIGARLPQPVSYLQAFNEIRRGLEPHASGNFVVAKAGPPNADHGRQMLMESARD